MSQEEFLQRYKYDVRQNRLGGGSFGTVYKAYDQIRDREVAIKIAELKEFGNKTFSLSSEMEAVSQVKAHPNIAHYESVYQFTTPVGIYDYAIMQYYPEGNLKQLLEKKLSDEQKGFIAEGILDGVQHLHDANVIHRDLKPSNILVSKRGENYVPKIADFGLSKLTTDELASQFSNSFGGGTLAYSAPEQLMGKTLRLNADIWSVGVLLYELFIGTRPFKSKTSTGSSSASTERDIYDQILSAPLPAEVQNIPSPYQEIVSRCLEKDPDLRVRTIRELRTIQAEAQVADGNSAPDNESPAEQHRLAALFSSAPEPAPQEEGTLVFTSEGKGASNTTLSQGPTQPPSRSPKTEKKNKRTKPVLLFLGTAVAASGLYFSGVLNNGGTTVDGSMIPPISVDDFQNTANTNAQLSELDRADDYQFEMATNAGTLVGYRQYQEQYPEGRHLEIVNSRIDSLEELEAAAEAEREAERERAEEERRQQAAQAEAQAWRTARNQNTIDAYRNYINAYPDGPNVAEANRRISGLTRVRLSSYQSPNDLTFDYHGQVRNNIPNGRGTATYDDGSVYQGNFSNGVRSGNGKLEAQNYSYEGNWRNDKFNGQGTYSWAAGGRYVGQFEDDFFQGQGTFYASEGATINHCPSCVRYEGNWIRDERTGNGRCYNSSGRLIYEGRFKDGQPTETYPNR